MLRSAASPGSVGFGRSGSGTSGLLMTPLPAGHLFGLEYQVKGAPAGAPLRFPGPRASLDFGFAELDVLLRDRVVLLLGELVGHGARILPGHVVEARVGAGHELDLD